MINDILAEHTGLSAERIAEETERDNYMTAQEALEYGLIDEVLKKSPEGDKKKKGKSEKKDEGNKE